MAPSPPPGELSSLRPTCEIVWRILEAADEPLSHTEIVSRSARSTHSVCRAIRQLPETHPPLIELRRSTGDTRPARYTIHDLRPIHLSEP